MAVDVDEVLFPLSPQLIAWHNANFATAYSLADNVTYVLGDVWGRTYPESVEKVHAFLGLDHRKVDPLPGALEGIAAMREHYRLVVVTSRDQQLEGSTLAWLTQHFPDAFEDVVFAGNPHTGLGFRSKAEVCRDLQAISIVDDSPSAVEECSAVGVHAILFGDYPWNQVEQLPVGAGRASAWNQVADILVPPRATA